MERFVELDLENYGRNLIFRGNLNKCDSLKTISVKAIFTRELREIWPELNFKDVVKTKEQFLELPIWHNSLIRIENKPVFNEKLFSLGISKVKDFEKEQYNFLSHTDFIEKCNCQLQPLKYFGLHDLPLNKSIIAASHKTLLFQFHKIHFLPYSLGTQKKLRSSTKNVCKNVKHNVRLGEK